MTSRTPRALGLALALVATLVASGAAATPAAAASPERYAALGDSFSAGVGTGRPDLGGRSGGEPCERSSLAYPSLWAQQHAGTALTFAACSGARISTVRREQVPSIPRDTTLVTVTMGGNDAGFSPVIAVCLLAREDEACRVAVGLARAVAVAHVPISLTMTVLAIRRRAPQARIVVLGYPRLFELGDCGRQAVPDAGRRAAINRGTDLLDDVIRRTSSALDVRFVDVRGRFAGHGVCAAPGQAWIQGPGAGRDAYHPTATGQAQGYLPALNEITG